MNRATRQGHNTLVLDEEIPQDKRMVLMNRARQLHAALATKASYFEIRQQIESLMISFNSVRRIDKTEAALITAKYIDILQELPLWAIARACHEIERGTVSDVSLDYPPAAPRLREVVLRFMAFQQEEYARITSLLRARIEPPRTPEEIKRMARAATAWLNGDDPKKQELLASANAERIIAIEKVEARMRNEGRAFIEREYRERGEEPVRAGSLLVSRSLANMVRRWQQPGP
jgi:hypothetical protein